MTVAEFPFVKRLYIELNNGEILEADRYAVKQMQIEQLTPPISFRPFANGIITLDDNSEAIKIRVTIVFEGETMKFSFEDAPEELLAGANFQLGDGNVDD